MRLTKEVFAGVRIFVYPDRIYFVGERPVAYLHALDGSISGLAVYQSVLQGFDPAKGIRFGLDRATRMGIYRQLMTAPDYRKVLESETAGRLCRAHRITREQLKAIAHEGIELRWPLK